MSLIKILTYNMYLLPPGIGGRNGAFKTERLYEFIHFYMQNYDIICLQEVFGMFSKRLDILINAAKEYNYYIVTKKHSILEWPIFPIDSGLVILSRFPIKDVGFCAFPRGSHADMFAQKGILYCKIQIDNQLINIYNLHMQAQEYKEIRKIQLQTLCNYIKPNFPTIICGDFNIAFNNIEYNILKNAMYSIDKNAKNTLQSVNNYCNMLYSSGIQNGNEELIDYIWLLFNNNISIKESTIKTFPSKSIHYNQLSDHNAICTTINFM